MQKSSVAMHSSNLKNRSHFKTFVINVIMSRATITFSLKVNSGKPTQIGKRLGFSADDDDHLEQGNDTKDSSSTTARDAVHGCAMQGSGAQSKTSLSLSDMVSHATMNAVMGEKLISEGDTLAENGQLNEALGKWSRAKQLQPRNFKLLEQMSQVLLKIAQENGEIDCSVDNKETLKEDRLRKRNSLLFDAVKFAESAVEINPDFGWVR